ncbi:hypothetical protein [Pelagimonas varians]|uniref:Outer membrane protein beta-barrel domain-containing protein n=1 Tax=Pelagimonas varians TaxID=696760 RepID=A0A238KSD1_9RHOB|nr:hypothetical protein [Pelagimonas varians]PYG32512.1 hypothetical protein C8N36_103261 [Pelagimonas varians]SMX45754.1 hypothetical protein PEV8663_03105 [Pelagimonas varians]
MPHKILSASAFLIALGAPAIADPTLGFGLNFTFGNGTINSGVGVRLFSNDTPDEFAGSLGVDYMFGSQGWRGSIGAAYMMENSYLELNGGYDFNRGGFDFGLGGGWANTDNDDDDDDNNGSDDSLVIMDPAGPVGDV